MQEQCNSIANAFELRLSCINPSTCPEWRKYHKLCWLWYCHLEQRGRCYVQKLPSNAPPSATRLDASMITSFLIAWFIQSVTLTIIAWHANVQITRHVSKVQYLLTIFQINFLWPYAGIINDRQNPDIASITTQLDVVNNPDRVS